MDPTCWKVVGGMGTAISGLVVAVIVLWKAYSKAQEARIKALEENHRVLEELKMAVLTRRK